MHTLFICNGLRKSNLQKRLFQNDTLRKVLQERGGYIDDSRHVSHWYWKTPKIGMTFQDNGTMNGHSIVGLILPFSEGWDRHFCQCLSTNLWSIANLTKMKHQTRCLCTHLKEVKEPCLVHFFFTRQCYFVLCQAKFVISSAGSQSFLRMIWILSTCMQKWASMSAQKCSSNSKIRQIPLCL